mgnify:CR=1 FL=1
MADHLKVWGIMGVMGLFVWICVLTEGVILTPIILVMAFGGLYLILLEIVRSHMRYWR